MGHLFQIGDLVVINYPAYRGNVAVIKKTKEYPNGAFLYDVLILETGEQTTFSESCLKELGNK
jgi:hypothetical protein